MKPRTVVAAIAAVGTIAVGTGIGVNLADAAGTGTASAFVPIVPCRLVDTRPTDNVGERNGALNPGETLTLNVVGTHGNCNIPAGATGIASNVTVTNPTAPSFLTVYPADAAKPNSSNLNWTATSSPTPNQVTVGLSAGGAINVWNYDGRIDVIIDIVGYYQPSTAGSAGAQGPKGDTGATGHGSSGTNWCGWRARDRRVTRVQLDYRGPRATPVLKDRPEAWSTPRSGRSSTALPDLAVRQAAAR